MDTTRQITSPSANRLGHGTARSVALSFAFVMAAGCALEEPELEAGGAPAEEEALDQPAEAETEAALSAGGCTGDFPISSCISRSGNNVIADFYMNAATPDSSRYWYVLEVSRTNLGTWRDSTARRLDHSGHYSARSVNIATMPWRGGCARTIVNVYTQSWSPHGVYTSPPVCY